MSSRLTQGREERRLEEGQGDGGGVKVETGAGGAEEGVKNFVGDSGDADADADAESGVGCKGGEFLTAVISLSFVAPPGHTAPNPQTVEYRMDLTASESSQEIEVFLGEVDYNHTT